jgi:hypothetical protein
LEGGTGVSVGVAVGVAVGVGVSVGVGVALAVSVGKGVSVAGGTAVSAGGMINSGVGVGSSPLQAAAKRRINIKLTISLRLITHLGKAYKGQFLAARLSTAGTIFPETSSFRENKRLTVYGTVMRIV